MPTLKIILVDWSGYPLSRKKRIGHHTIKCGIEPILSSLNSISNGLNFELFLVINLEESKLNLGWKKNFKRRKTTPHITRDAYLNLKKRFPVINEIHFRNNLGHDIGAYNFGLELLRNRQYSGEVLFMNSSLRPSHKENWLLDYQNLFTQSSQTGLLGVSLNSSLTIHSPPRFMPHVQSFFLYSSMKHFNEVFPNGLPGSGGHLNKKELILNGEVAISQRILAAGYSIRSSTFPDFNYSLGDQWSIPEGDIRFNQKFTEYINQA